VKAGKISLRLTQLRLSMQIGTEGQEKTEKGITDAN
jgi:hypothetical protein